MRSATRRNTSSPHGTYAVELSGGWDDGALGVILRGLDAVERVVVVEAEPVGVQQDRFEFVEGVGLSGQADAVALHGLDEDFDDLVVEGAHPAALESRVEVVDE